MQTLQQELQHSPAATPPRDDLDQRIAAAFADGASKEQVRGLIQETAAAVEVIEESACRARERALDPALSAGALTQARQEAADGEFRRDRLRAAVPRLRERLAELKDNEDDERRRALYETARAERDRLAAALRDIYPELAQRLAELLPQLAENNRQVEGINARLPRGADRLLVAELVARGLFGRVGFGSDIASIVRDLRLPAWSEGHPSFTWPRG